MVIQNLSELFLTEMSGSLNETENYIWSCSDSDCLGEGTFGKVFLGAHKRTGDKVAVKTFKHDNHTETRMLQSLKHQYIIQLHAIETETVSRNMVMILEYCNGGSLSKLLSEPENVCGLVDSEFLLVLEHLSGGLEYLKRHNVIHRDVKPDNIMRHIFDDGRIIYKLADFGAARELPEGQYFNSLHGTEPYLNPQMFKVCFFREPAARREFDSNTDLWSIGVTLYQIATGNLPFRVQDRHVMLTIYNEMSNNYGIISAVQQSNSERVVYQNKLPSTCRLSAGLKDLITPLIAGLFIHDRHKQWSFTLYYNTVLELVARKAINVFYVNKLQMLKVYVKSDDSFDGFRYYIRQQTEVSEEDQIFLYKQQLIVGSWNELPSTETECIFFFDKSNTDVKPNINIQLSFEDFADFNKKFMQSDGSDDVFLAYSACKDLCFCSKLMEYQSMVYKYFGAFMKDFSAFSKEKLKEQFKILDNLKEKYNDIKSKTDILEKTQNLTNSKRAVSSRDFDFNGINLILRDIDSISIASDISNTSHDSFLKIAIKELTDMKRLYRNFSRFRSNKRLYYYEKIKIVHCVRTILEILMDKMDPSFHVFVKESSTWFKDVFFSCIEALGSSKKLVQRLRDDMKRYEDEIYCKTIENIQSSVRNKENCCNEPSPLIDTLIAYQEKNVDSTLIIEENIELMAKMNNLVLNLNNEFVYN